MFIACARSAACWGRYIVCNLFVQVMCRRRCSHVGCVKRGRLVVGMSRPSHHGTTSYFAQLAAFSLDHETLQQRFVVPPSLLSFEAGGKGGIVDRILHARHPNFLFFLLDTPSTRNGSSRKSNARYDTVFSFIFHRSQLDRAEKMGSGTKFEFELEISKSCFLDFTISRVFRSLEVEAAVWI